MKLDHFHGRNVTEVISRPEPHEWAIRLEGDVLIKNLDKRRTQVPPKEIIGMVLFDSATDEDANRALMKFGSITPQPGGGVNITTIAEVDLTNTLYEIAAPEKASVMPGVLPEQVEVKPWDDERTPEGPSEAHQPPQEAQK